MCNVKGLPEEKLGFVYQRRRIKKGVSDDTSFLFKEYFNV